jgi:hexulose-6-phosphate isomerase
MIQPEAGRSPDRPSCELSRRELLAYTAVFGSAFMAAQGLADDESSGAAGDRPAAEGQPAVPAKRYPMKKSINLWALPYPKKMSIRECFQLCKAASFDGVEVNFALDGDLAPGACERDVRAIGEAARKIGIAVSGVCSFLFWPYSLTHNDPQRRRQGLDFAEQMIRCAGWLGTDNLLVVPGATYIPWLENETPVPPETCDRRAREAIHRLLPAAEKAGVYLNVENIFVNGYLHSPQEMIAFVDSFGSERVCVHFDTGNIMLYHFPEHWIPLLGKRIRNVHLKEYSKRVHEFNLHTFRPLLDGTTDWPAVMRAFDAAGYRGYLTFEYFNPFPCWPEALVWQTSDALDRMLGRKVS